LAPRGSSKPRQPDPFRGLTAGVQVSTAPNPGPKTLSGTNVYLVGSRVLIDAGPDDARYIDVLAESILRGGGATALLLTHGHPDHAGGAAALAERLGVPVYLAPNADPSVLGSLPDVRELGDRDTFDTPSGAVRAVATPGHARDHFCFWLEAEGVLFCGDTVLGVGTSLVARPEGDMAAYLQSLRRIRALHPRLIAPGHGPPVGDPLAKIDEYLEHRRTREQALMQALEGGPVSLDELVDSVYGPQPSEIRRLALLSAEAQLHKLMDEGMVTMHRGAYALSEEAPPAAGDA